MWEHPSNNQVEKLKKKNQDIYPHVELLVNEWDPIGLIEGGAPKDEYDCVSVQLIELLENGKRGEEIYNFIIHELYEHFGMGTPSVAEGYEGKLIQKHQEFSEQISNWYENYKKETSENG